MRDYQINASQEQPAIQLKPIISYPRVAEAGETYLLTIDVRLADGSPWPYQEEEFEISFVLETAPFFTHEPLGEHEPGIVLHRFGGTYGAAEYLLTASKQEVSAGHIKIAFLNGWGLPVAQLELECEVKQNAPKPAGKSKIAKKRKQTPFTGPAPSGGTSPFTGPVPSGGTSPFTGPAPLTVTPPRLAGQGNFSSVAYDVIEKRLAQTGWEVQVADRLRYTATGERMAIPRGNVAVIGYPSFEKDYLLFIDKTLVGIVKTQTQAAQFFIDRDEPVPFLNLPKVWIPPIRYPIQELLNVPFIYSTTGYLTVFKNYLEPQIPSRDVYIFHQPATLALWLEQFASKTSFRALLRAMPPLTQGDLYDYQFAALQRIEQSLSKYQSRILIQMETSTGKTYTSINSTYRLLAYANAQHILYITEAREYTLEEFQNFTLPGDTRKFTDRYTVRLIDDKAPQPSVHVYIGTIEDIYSLYATGRAGQLSTVAEDIAGPLDAVRYLGDYTTDLPIEYFDAVFLPQCEHINYSVWRNVLNCLDTFFIGVADEVSDDVFHFFRSNPVYSKKEAENIPEAKQGADVAVERQKQLLSIIKSVRRLLRKDTGLSYESDRLAHLIWLLFLKYLDDFELAQEELLGSDYIPVIENRYRWRNWASGEQSRYRLAGDDLLHFVNYNLMPYLGKLSGSDYRDIRTIIGSVFRSNDNRIKSGYILLDIVAKLNTINFNIFNDVHNTSVLYENMLKEMCDADKLMAGFYTPRPIVRFIIDHLQPQLGERILDPACGTAGFLVEAYEHLKDRVHTLEQHRQLQDDLIGIDRQPIPYLLAVMNMLLHGIDSPNLQERNALASHMGSIQDSQLFDIIVTNPPFGIVEDRELIFPGWVRTSRYELLFLQYIMAHLKRSNGRCGVVMPNSLLFIPNGVVAIRKEILGRFNLHTIVRLPEGVLAPSTGIPINILFFTADEGLYNREKDPSTQEIWYYEILPPEGRKSFTKTRPIQDEDFDACRAWWDHREENEHAWKVSIEQVRENDYNLNYKNPRSQNEK